jgi:MFS family permease
MPDRMPVCGYRWVVLAAFMAVNLTIQVLWISYAPISSQAQSYYGVSGAAIGALAMSFMVAYLPFSFLASQLITHRGLRFASGVGALLAGVAGVARGLVGPHFALALLATAGAAIAQPFLLNAWTTLSSQWFPRSQRATAVSLITLANLLGAGIGMAVTPMLVKSMSISEVQLTYGLCALAVGVVFVLVARDRPPTPPDLDAATIPTTALAGVRQALKVGPFVAFLVIAFVTMGVFNGLSTWVEEIVRPRGFSSVDAGNLGALLLLGGVVGAVVMSALSDRSGRRLPYLTLALVASAPALVWLTFAGSLVSLLTAAFLLGFFMTSALPVGMQYAAEITAPTPEGTSNGLIQLFGQASVVVVYLMTLTRTPSGSYAVSLCVLAGLLLVSGLVVSRLPEPARALDVTAVPVPTGAELVETGPTIRIPQQPAQLDPRFPRQRREALLAQPSRRMAARRRRGAAPAEVSDERAGRRGPE